MPVVKRVGWANVVSRLTPAFVNLYHPPTKIQNYLIVEVRIIFKGEEGEMK